MESIVVVEPTNAKEDLPSSEFNILLSRGKLSHPPSEIY